MPAGAVLLWKGVFFLPSPFFSRPVNDSVPPVTTLTTLPAASHVFSPIPFYFPFPLSSAVVEIRSRCLLIQSIMSAYYIRRYLLRHDQAGVSLQAGTWRLDLGCDLPEAGVGKGVVEAHKARTGAPPFYKTGCAVAEMKHDCVRA